jgi:hypothetical protein
MRVKIYFWQVKILNYCEALVFSTRVIYITMNIYDVLYQRRANIKMSLVVKYDVLNSQYLKKNNEFLSYKNNELNLVTLSTNRLYSLRTSIQ